MKINDSSCTSCSCGGCATIGTVVGIIFGAIVGVLFALGLIPFITTAVWIVFGIAAAVLLYVMGIVLLSSCDSSCNLCCCLKKYLNCLLVGAIGTIISALAALAITLVTTTLLIEILIAIGAFFFAFMLASLILFITCAADSGC